MFGAFKLNQWIMNIIQNGKLKQLSLENIGLKL